MNAEQILLVGPFSIFISAVGGGAAAVAVYIFSITARHLKAGSAVVHRLNKKLISQKSHLKQRNYSVNDDQDL